MIQARVIAAPANEPLSLPECYAQLHLDDPDSNGRPDDALILTYAAAAREYCENFTGLSLAMKDYEVVLNAWPDDDLIELPYPPFISLLNGITISDEISDNAIDEDSYLVDNYTGQIVAITPLASWPTLATGNLIRIRYRAGYGDESEAAGQVPAQIKAAMLLMLGHLYMNREATAEGQLLQIPLGVEALLRPYRVLLGMA